MRQNIFKPSGMMMICNLKVFTSLSDTHNLAVMNQTKYIIDIIHDNLDGPQSNNLPSSWNWRTEET